MFSICFICFKCFIARNLGCFVAESDRYFRFSLLQIILGYVISD